MPITNNNEEQVLQQEQLDVVQEIDRQDNYEPTIPPPAPTNGIFSVQAIDNDAPIIFLFGPPASGKTMTLVRLYKYLVNKKHLKIEPEPSFVQKDGGEYEKRCKNFDKDANSKLAAEATKGVDFMLLNVSDNNGRRICQILESPGEKLFDPDPNKEDSFNNQFVSTIMSSENRKVFIFILEPNYKDPETRERYVKRIKQIKKDLRNRFKVIFLYNKIDKSDTLDNNGHVNMESLKKRINNSYLGLLDLFKVHGPRAIFKKYDCHLIPFQTGNYPEEFNTVLNKKVKLFVEGSDEYPKELWNTIKKCL